MESYTVKGYKLKKFEQVVTSATVILSFVSVCAMNEFKGACEMLHPTCPMLVKWTDSMRNADYRSSVSQSYASELVHNDGR